MNSFDFNLVFLPLLVIFFALVAYFGLWLWWRGQQQKGQVTRSLNMGLLIISLPAQASEKEQSGKDPKQIIGVMEQVFASLAHFREGGARRLFFPKPYLVLEMASGQNSPEVIFFLSAPTKHLEVVKKVIYGFYPDAHIQETSDYNIFNESGTSIGSFLLLKKNFALPLRTYKELDSDPLGEILNIMAKLRENSEGAAFQLVFTPAPASWTSRPRRILSEMEKGKNFAQARQEAEKNPAVGFLGEMARAGKKEDPAQAPLSPKTLSVADRKITEAISAKINKPGFACNLRLLASAPTAVAAEGILAQLESAFAQFASPELNAFQIVRPKKGSLERLIYEYAFRLFCKKNQLILNSEELTSIFHFSVAGTKAPRLKSIKAKNAAPPADLPKEGLLLGKNMYRGTETMVRMLPDDRRRHLYVVGQTGTGKTYFLQELARQDIQAGQGVAVIDPHGDLTDELLGLIPPERLADIIYFNPGDLQHPLGLNMLEYDPRYPEQKTFIVNEMIVIFDKLYDLKQTGGPIFEQYMRNVLLLLMDDPDEQATLMDVPRVFADSEYRRRLLDKCRNQVTRDFWQKEAEKAGGEAALQNVTPYITSKFNTFVANDYMRPIISQAKSAFNFRQVMDEGKILLVNLSKGRLGDINSNLLGMIVVGKLTMGALSRVDQGQAARRDFFLYIDEFQNVTTDSISVILSEARKYRLNLIIAHQYIKQLAEKVRDAVFGNVGSLCAFRVGAEDAEALEKQLAPVFSASDLMELDNRCAYLKLLIDGRTSRPFNILTLDAQPGDPAVAQKVKEFSAQKYGRPDA